MTERMQQPLLTVAVTTYNRWAGCRAAVERLVGTRDERVELVVVDDCSDTSASDDLLAFFEQHDVLYLRHETNNGLAKARNTAIKSARGKFFSFCDDDDVWAEDMMSRFLDACSIAAEDVGVIIGYQKPRRLSCKILHETRQLVRLIAAGVTPPVAAQVYRASLLRQIGGYRENVRTGVDHDLWISLAGTGCKCQTLFEIIPRIDAGLSADRMTTNEKKRRKGIEAALDIWEPEVTRVLGRDFARHLRDCYRTYLNYSFFRKSVAEKNVLEAIKRLVHHGVAWSFFRNVSRKLGVLPYCGAFPPFRGRLPDIPPNQDAVAVPPTKPKDSVPSA